MNTCEAQASQRQLYESQLYEAQTLKDVSILGPWYNVVASALPHYTWSLVLLTDAPGFPGTNV